MPKFERINSLSEIKWLVFIAKTNDFVPEGEVLFIKPYFSQGAGGFSTFLTLEKADAQSYEVRSETAYGAIKKAKALFHTQTTCKHSWKHDKWASGEPFNHCSKCGLYGDI